MTAKLKTDIKTIGRDIINNVLQRLNAKRQIPENFIFLNALSDIAAKIGKKPVFVLWNDGEVKLSETGGRDCIACLRRENGIIKGWSI